MNFLLVVVTVGANVNGEVDADDDVG